MLTWGPQAAHRVFLRAESHYNVASEIERVNAEPGPSLLPAYGGTSPHERSHGESLVDLMTHWFRPGRLFLLDEPEAALSVRGCMAAWRGWPSWPSRLARSWWATHSPIMLALPGAIIYEIVEDGGIEPVDYDQALPVRLTRDFLATPERFLRHLLSDDERLPVISGWAGSGRGRRGRVRRCGATGWPDRHSRPS